MVLIRHDVTGVWWIMQFRFDDHVLDLERRELRRGRSPVAVEPQVFELLAYLIRNQDRVVGTDELFDAVWSGPDRFASTLTSRINAARAVGDTGRSRG